jgi:hypothetical protein
MRTPAKQASETGNAGQGILLTRVVTEPDLRILQFSMKSRLGG